MEFGIVAQQPEEYMTGITYYACIIALILYYITSLGHCHWHTASPTNLI